MDKLRYILLNFLLLVGVISVDGKDEMLEVLHIQTDRDIYCTNELVLVNIHSITNINWSSVVNIELISCDGQKLLSKKLLFNDGNASGVLKIPTEIKNGNYYLQAYTKWMRNQSPYKNAFKLVTIINPDSEELFNPINEDGSNLHSTLNDSVSNLNIRVDGDEFSRNSDVSLNVGVEVIGQIKSYSIAIVKKGSIEGNRRLQFKDIERKTEAKFIPETRGISISGKVINKSDSVPISFAKVWLTLMLPNRVSKEVFCNERGEFNIDLGRRNNNVELVIQASSEKDELDPVLLIDNDFAFDLLKLPYVPIALDSSKLELYQDLAISAQLANIYTPFEAHVKNMDSITNFFYGRADRVMKIDDYIALPSLEDFIKELMPNLRISNSRKGKSISIIGQYPELSMYKPMVLVDMISVANIEDVFKLSPKLFNRIEVIRSPYLKGDNIYGGIIHFVTNNAQLNDLKLKSETLLVNYEMEALEFKKQAPIEAQDFLPKIGNCLFWKPNNCFTLDNEESITFNTGHEKGIFQLIIQGVDENGKCYYGAKDLIIN